MAKNSNHIKVTNQQSYVKIDFSKMGAADVGRQIEKTQTKQGRLKTRALLEDA